MLLTIKDLTDRKLKELYYNNLTYKEIADIHNCSIGCISRRLKRLIKDGYIVKRPNKKELIISNNIDKYPFILEADKNKNEVINLYKDGIDPKEIAKNLQCSYQLILKIIADYNNKKDMINRYDKDIIEYIIELYKNHIPFSTMQKILSIDANMIFSIVRECIDKGMVNKRKFVKPLGSVQLKVIELYRQHYSISLISDNINRSLKDTDNIIKKLIKDGVIKKRNTSCKQNNIIKMREDKDLFIRMYKYGLSIQNIANYYEVSQKDVNIYLQHILSIENIEPEDYINNSIFIDKKKPKDISLELEIPEDCIYKCIMQVK